MALLTDSLREQLRNIFARLSNPVTLVAFTRQFDATGARCEVSEEARELVETLASVSDGKIRAEMYDLARNPEQARLYNVDKVPAIVVLGDRSGRRDFGIRFFGSPGGYEFGTLVEDIRMASVGNTGLSSDTIDALADLESPVHIQVFVTPTCPYCPRAVLLAHKLAIASELVTADAVDATQFPELADKYEVYGVPKTVINEHIFVEGAVSELELVTELTPLLQV
jgi:glutaredoxin-like protein